MFQNVELQTPRLIIRPLRPADAAQMHEVVNQVEVMKYLPEEPMSLAEVRELIVWLNECYEKNTPENIVKFTCGVLSKENERVMGWCGLGPLDFRPAETEIFYGLSQQYWGRGLATEAARAMLHFGFENIGLNRIVAVTNAENVASTKVIEKLGLEFVETLTGLPEKHGHYENNLYYRLSRERYFG